MIKEYILYGTLPETSYKTVIQTPGKTFHRSLVVQSNQWFVMTLKNFEKKAKY